MALLFLLVYAGAIAVLVLFVVMMLDVKAIENPWSVNQKRFFFIGISLFFVCLILLISNSSLLMSFRVRSTNIISSLVSFNVLFYDEPTKNILVGLLDENLTEFFRLWFYNDCITNSFDKNMVWFIDFDSPCGLNDPSYLLYSTHAIL